MIATREIKIGRRPVGFLYSGRVDGNSRREQNFGSGGQFKVHVARLLFFFGGTAFFNGFAVAAGVLAIKGLLQTGLPTALPRVGDKHFAPGNKLKDCPVSPKKLEANCQSKNVAQTMLHA